MTLILCPAIACPAPGCRLGVRPVLGFLWLVAVYAGTYAMKAVREGRVGLEYISSLMNSGSDTVALFVARWLLWLSVPFVIYAPVARALSPAWARGYVAVWYLAVFTGVEPRVFGGESLEALAYAHYAASVLVMLYSVAALWARALRRLAAFWLLVVAVYGGLFVADQVAPLPGVPDALKVVEAVFFFSVAGVFLFVPPPEPSDDDDARALPAPASVPSRERAAARARM